MLSSVTAHRRFLHQIPEPCNPLPQTLALVTGVLRGYRCKYDSPVPGSVCAWFDFGKPETVAFRAELDASAIQENNPVPYASRHPGYMHARGHDAHTAMLLSLSEWLATVKPDCPRNILILFQPAAVSDTPGAGNASGGADALCRTGILEQYHVSRIFALHLWPGLPAGVITSRPGAFMARSNDVDIRITGKTVALEHADGERNDALLAGVAFLRRAHAMTDAAPPPCILRFGHMYSGAARTAISGETVLEGSLRTYSEETYSFCRENLIRLSREVTAQYGTPVSVSLSGGNGAVWNHETLYSAVLDAVPSGAVAELDAPVLASSDFSFYQKRAPGVLYFLGTGNTPDLDSPNFDFNDELILPKGLEFLKQLAVAD